MTSPPSHQSPAELAAKKCVPCEGGVPKYSAAEAEAQVASLPGWRLTHDGTRIRRDWTLPDFRSAIKMLNNVAALAERERHHPDLHLEGYRQAWIEIFTHAIGGLSENDFILAAKIDAVTPPACPAGMRRPEQAKTGPREGRMNPLGIRISRRTDGGASCHGRPSRRACRCPA